MERVQGVGGVFIRGRDRQKLADWYAEHLGIDVDRTWWGHVFQWADQDRAQTASTTWSVFAHDTDYFGDRGNGAMINFRVKDLHAMLDQLRGAGCDVLDKVEESDFGKFGWVTDCEGNRVELWEPPE